MFDQPFWEGLWQGVFQLIALGLIALFGNVIWQRTREKYARRQDLVDEIETFTIHLYKPRKLYQTLTDPTCDVLKSITDSAQRETERTVRIQRTLEDMIEAMGRFRSIQIHIVPLYGYDVEIFGHYLAIWRYLKEVRGRMERRESLFVGHESVESADTLYRILDTFRYLILTRGFIRKPPESVMPPPSVFEAMKKRGEAVYATYFASSPSAT